MESEFTPLRQDPKNYRWGLIYICAEDPCVVVPKRVPWMGWTINFAHPWAWRVLAGSVLLAVGPSMVVMLWGIGVGLPRDQVRLGVLFGAYFATLAISVTALIGVAKWMSNRPFR